MEQNNKASSQKKTVILVSIIACLIIAGLVTGIFFLARSDTQVTGQVRDIFIIILALESLLIGAALIILVIQLALLSNLIQNEITPILASTKETIRTVKGTSQFISEKAINPIVTLGGILAGGRKLIEIIGFIKKEK
jgi:hypothetical protein